MTTPKAITFIVVGGLCAMALTYMMTLAACVIIGIEPPEKLMGSFKDAGMFVLGAFTGILVNTRSQASEQPTLAVHARSNSDPNVHPAADTNPNTPGTAAKSDSAANAKPDSIAVSATATTSAESS